MERLKKVFWRNRKYRKRRRVAAAWMAAVVVFVTTYRLILPAITLELQETGRVAGMYLEQDELLLNTEDREYSLAKTGLSGEAEMDAANLSTVSEKVDFADLIEDPDEEGPNGNPDREPEEKSGLSEKDTESEKESGLSEKDTEDERESRLSEEDPGEEEESRILEEDTETEAGSAPSKEDPGDEKARALLEEDIEAEEESELSEKEESEETEAGIDSLDLGIAVIESAAGEPLPAEADGHAFSLHGDSGEEANGEVEAYLLEHTAKGRRQLRRAGEKTSGLPRYQAFEISLDGVDEEEYEDGFRVRVQLPEAVCGRDFSLYHIHETEEGERIVSEIRGEEFALLYASSDEGEAEEVSGFSFVTQNFSEFVLRYTVDFAYLAGQYTIPGGTYIFLSDLLEALALDVSLASVTDVSFSNDNFIGIEALEGDWRITSLAPFTSHETLTLNLEDGSSLLVQVEDDQAVYYEDLSRLLKTMIMYVDGEEVKDGDEVDVRDGMLYDLVLTFQEKGLDQFSDTEQLYFELPQNFVLPDGFTDSLTINLGIDGKVYGNKLTYDKEHNRLLLDWNKEDRKYSRMTAAGNLRFTVRLQGYIEPGEVKYGDNFKFIANRYDPHNASVAKSGVLNSDDLEHQKITYTVTVRSDGSTENLILTDVMGTALSYAADPVTWSRVSLMESQAEIRKVETTNVGTQASETAPYLQYTAEGMVISIPETHDGDVLTFTYTADVDYTKIAQSGNASFEEMGNTVQIFGDGDPVDNKAEYHQKEVAYSDLQKSVGEPSARYKAGEKEYQNLTWVIDTNAYKMISFAGTDITDQITVYTDDAESPQIMDLPTEYIGEGIVIEVYAWNSDKSQAVLQETRNIPWSELSVTDMDAAQGWTYHVPEDDSIYEYKITYQTRTDVTGLSQNADVHNTAASRGGTDEVSRLLHPKGNGLGVGKRVVGQTEDDVTWEITVSLNDIAEGWNQRLVVEDLLPYKYLPKKNGETGSSDLYKEKYIEGTLEVTGLQDGESYTLFLSQPDGWWGDDNHVRWRDTNQTWDQKNWPLIRAGHRYEGNDNTAFKREEDQTNAIFVEFFKDEAQTEIGLNPPEDGGDARTITIRFKTNINKEWRDWAWEYFGKDAIWNGLRHTNHVYANSQHEKADVIVTGNYLVKAFKEKPTWTTDNIWRFETYIAGKQPGSSIVIDDYFDGSLWRFAAEREVQFRAGTEPNYAKAVATPGHSEFWVAGEYGSGVEVLEDGHVRFTIADLPLKSDGKTWPFYGVNYFLAPKDDEAWKTIQMEALNNGGIVRYINTAESEGMTDSDQYPVSLLPEYKPVVKSDPISIPDQGDMVEYTIVLNQQKQRLNDGSPITMEDEFNSHLSIDYSSITIATEPTGHEEEISYDYSGFIGTFVIPDETKVTITYQARVIPDRDAEWTDNKTEVTVYNVANMLGWKDGGEKKITVTKGGDAEIFRIRLFKYGSGHMENGLNGAVFGLYQKAGEDYIPMKYSEGEDAGTPITFTTGTVSMLNGVVQSEEDLEKLTGQERKQLVTRDGYALVELRQDEHGVHLEKDKTYYLKEEQEPEGYQKDTSVEYYSFTFDDTPEYDGGGWLYYNNDILKVRNSPTDGAFSIRKKIDGNYALSEAQKGSLRFTVQKKNADDTWRDVSVKVPQTDEQGEVRTDEDGQILYSEVTALTYEQIRSKFTIDHIGAGTFRIVESVADGGTAVPGSVDHIVSFTIDDMDDDLTPGADGKSYVQFDITDADIAGGIEHEIVFTDTYTQEMVTLKVQKRWLDAENIARVPGGAEVTLGVFVVTDEQIAEMPVQRVVLDGTPDIDNASRTGEIAAWVAQFAKLPKKDDEGNEIAYAVREISGPNGYDVYYGEVSAENDADYLLLHVSETPVITNKQETVSYTVVKTWEFLPWRDNLYELPENAAVTLGIYYGTTQEEAYAKFTSGAKAYKSVTLQGSGKEGNEHWKAVFDNLPKADGTGREYVWILVETRGYAGFTPKYGNDGENYIVLSNVGDSSNIVINEEGTQFTFSKVWKDAVQNPAGWQGDIEVTLRSKTEDAADWSTEGTFALKVIEDESDVSVSAVKVSSSDLEKNCSWSVRKGEDNLYTFTVSGLEGAAGNGSERKPLIYSVVETGLPDYKPPSYAGSDGRIMINRTYAQNGQIIINTSEDSIELPSAGGPGTKLIYLLGSIMIAAAGALLARRRRPD